MIEPEVAGDDPMTIPFSGGCACGAVRYTCNAEPIVNWKCHCRDCQRATGGPYFPCLYLTKDALTIAGELRFYETPGQTGSGVRRGFCPQCGSPILGIAGRFPEFAVVSAASLDDPAAFRPQVELWTSSATAWDFVDDSLAQFPQQPTDEEMQALLASLH